jgi:hypothetical protein
MRVAAVLVAMVAGSGCRYLLDIGGLEGAVDSATGDGVPVDADQDAPDGATIVDARTDAGFDVSTCPASYNLTVASTPGSRYRLISASATFMEHHDTCKSDALGITHLIVIQDQVEAQEVAALVIGGEYYVGAVQTPDQVIPTTAWSNLTGGPVPTLIWQSNQPNDGDGVENNVQNVGAADNASGLLDDTSLTDLGAFCECDGYPIDPSVEAWIP